MNSNLQRLGDTLSGRMKKTAGAAVPVTVELGTMSRSLALVTDSMATPIPQGQYMVDIRLRGEFRTDRTGHSHDGGAHGGHQSGDGAHTHTGGDHDHQLPGQFRALKAGDRVLVIWCGNEPVITAIVAGS